MFNKLNIENMTIKNETPNQRTTNYYDIANKPTNMMIFKWSQTEKS